jgi:hypothetical protein
MLRIVGDDVKGFIVVDEVRSVGETVAKDDTVVATNTATIILRRFGKRLDEFIIIVLAIIGSCESSFCHSIL